MVCSFLTLLDPSILVIRPRRARIGAASSHPFNAAFLPLSANAGACCERIPFLIGVTCFLVLCVSTASSFLVLWFDVFRELAHAKVLGPLSRFTAFEICQGDGHAAFCGPAT